MNVPASSTSMRRRLPGETSVRRIRSGGPRPECRSAFVTSSETTSWASARRSVSQSVEGGDESTGFPYRPVVDRQIQLNGCLHGAPNAVALFGLAGSPPTREREGALTAEAPALNNARGVRRHRSGGSVSLRRLGGGGRTAEMSMTRAAAGLRMIRSRSGRSRARCRSACRPAVHERDAREIDDDQLRAVALLTCAALGEAGDRGDVKLAGDQRRTVVPCCSRTIANAFSADTTRILWSAVVA